MKDMINKKHINIDDNIGSKMYMPTQQPYKKQFQITLLMLKVIPRLLQASCLGRFRISRHTMLPSEISAANWYILQHWGYT